LSTIQVAGHVCVDLKPQLTASGVALPGELVAAGPLKISVGGAVGNCGRVLADLGVDVSLSGSVGDDDLGALCESLLRRRHQQVDLAVVEGAATSYSVVVEPPGLERSFWHHTGANDAFAGDCPISATTLLHYGYPSLTPAMCVDDGLPIRRLFERAHRRGVATSLDLAFLAAGSPLRSLDWEALLHAAAPSCDVFCPSWDDIASSLDLHPDADEDMVKDWAETALGWGAAVVLVTLGNKGSYVRVAGHERLGGLSRTGIDPGAWADQAIWTAQPSVREIVTTNGAGDTYKAAFLARLVEGAPPQECLGFAGEVVARHLTGRPLSRQDKR
jgi:sugar/nucleoside kinase (ribokinase family)